LVPENELEIDSMEKAMKASSYAVLVFRFYIDKYYKFHKDQWEDPCLERQDLQYDDNNFVDEYTFTYTDKHESDTVSLQFFDLLQKHLESDAALPKDTDLYLLRNKSKVAIGFFEAGNFYPDYILWINTHDTQYMSFIDPKGLRYLQIENPKIQFYRTIKDLQNRPGLQATKGDKNIILNSFIVTGKKYAELRNR
jgi:hypothetical protein